MLKIKKYAVKSIFGPTIQGEGAHAGTPSVFVRFAGCNRWNGLAEYKAQSVCSFCDTDFVGGERLTANEIVERIKALAPNIGHITLTGGEPMLQVDGELVRLIYVNFDVYPSIETNGSIAIPEDVWPFAEITISPKQSPKETLALNTGWEHTLKCLYPFPIKGHAPDDYLTLQNEASRYLQPIEDANLKRNTKQAVDYLLNEGYKNGWKLSLQLHKILEVE